MNNHEFIRGGGRAFGGEDLTYMICDAMNAGHRTNNEFTVQ